MKKVFFKTMMAAVLAGAAMSSCVNEVEDLYNPEYIAKKQQYETQWRIKFGRIDPNEDWGFGTGVSDEAKAVTRTVYKETHEWANLGVIPPAEVSTEEMEAINNHLKNADNIKTVPYINFSDYWIQQVLCTEDGKNYLNQLHVVSASGKEDNALDSNRGETKTVYMAAVGTSGFYCTSSFSNKRMEDYIVFVYEGSYYVGFELYDKKSENESVGGDGIYNDWVIKLTPTNYTSAKRIICEDLGSIGDFDFNDVVFDVADAGLRWDAETGTNVREAVVTVHAAGGTLPIYVGGVEVHAALGVNSGVMANTGAPNGVDVPIASYRVRINDGYDVTSIPVTVESAEAGFYTLEAPTGKAPQKICVGSGFQWTTERTNIKDAYTTFPADGWENTSGAAEYLF